MYVQFTRSLLDGTFLLFVFVCVQSAQAGQGEGVVVTQFHMTGWPEHGRPASTGSVVEMLDMITKAQMSSGNRSITVLCKSVSVLEREGVISPLSTLTIQ